MFLSPPIYSKEIQSLGYLSDYLFLVFIFEVFKKGASGIDGENTKVLVNDEKSLKTFKELCDEIRGKKRIEIKSVDFTRVENNQILQLKVSYKKKGILGL